MILLLTIDTIYKLYNLLLHHNRNANTSVQVILSGNKQTYQFEEMSISG